jgi:glycosyltransferase involved in cell wall biosynthesis
MDRIAVSIITPTYNSASSIRNTINSVLNQKVKPIEYILVDNCSSDSTLAIINSYKSDFKKSGIRLIIISEPDKGIYDAINKGIQLATSSWVGIINSDDYYSHSAIKRLLLASTSRRFDIFHGDLAIYESGNEAKLYRPQFKSKFTMFLFHPTMFAKKDCYKKLGMYDLKFKLSADFDWILRARENGLEFFYDNHVISHYYKFGLSHKYRLQGIKEAFQIRRQHKYNLLIAFYYLTKEFFFGPVKSYVLSLCTLRRG